MENIQLLQAELKELQNDLTTVSAQYKPAIEQAIRSVEAQIADAERDAHHAATPKAAEPKAKAKKAKAPKPQADENGNLPDPSPEDVKPEPKPKPAKAKNTEGVKKATPKTENPKPPTKTMRERVAQTDKLPKSAKESADTVMIKCTFKAVPVQNAQVVNILGDEMVAYPGDVILYRAEDGFAFTVVAKSTFDKRCVKINNLEDGDKVKITVKTGDGKKIKVKKSGNITKEAKTPAQRETIKEVHAEAENVVKSMKAKKLNVAEFLVQAQGTPIEKYLFSAAKAYDNGDTTDRIVRVIATKDGGFYVGKQSDTVGQMIERTIARLVNERVPLTWYRVCGTRGIETDKNVPYEDIKKRAPLPYFGDDKLNRSLLKKIYDYPEGEFGSCKNLASQYYSALAKLKDNDPDNDAAAIKSLKAVGAKYRPKCLTGRWRDEYVKYNKEVSELAQEYKNRFPSLKFSEARKKVLNIMAQKYKAMGGKVNIAELMVSWKDDLGDDRGND
jgi:chemotaxis protein histidine kinase CheA